MPQKGVLAWIRPKPDAHESVTPSFAYMCKLVDSVNVKTIQNKCISFAGRLSERDIIDDSAELIVLMVCVRS